MSLYPDNNSNTNKLNDNSSNIIFPARVKDILLSNTQDFFKNSNGWGDIGLIKFQPLYTNIDNNSSYELKAKPLFSNIKSIPVLEEIVLIISAPSNNLNNDPNATDFYYFPFPVNIWNSNHHNVIPDIDKFNIKQEDINFGKYFTEKEGIKNLLYEEGDIIIEGRFGNSIRLSYTGNNKNPWSSVGEKGSPIIIIRNGQVKQDSSPWTPIYEDINGDDSSIYMTTDQEIPLELSCKNLKSFNITLASSFNSSIQIPDTNSF